jgi:hypothetical protein
LVIARNSSFTYRGQAVEVKRVGRELSVHYVLGGSVRKLGKRVRITTQLVEAETGVHVWGERYDRSLDDIFALQDEITLSTVGAIEPSLRAAAIERVKRKRPENLDAYDLVLRALPHVSTGMPEEARIAVPLLERAVALEPDYGLAQLMHPEPVEHCYVHVKAPTGIGAVQTFSYRHLTVGLDGIVEMSEADAAYLIPAGWIKLADGAATRSSTPLDAASRAPS